MKRRIYFLVPNGDVARSVSDDLLKNHIPERDIHVIANDKSVIRNKELSEAGLLQERDIVPAIERGVAVGGTTGLLAGVAAVTLPGIGLGLGGGAILLTGLAGAGFGAAVGPMIGISVPNSQIDAFRDAIDRGEFLMMIDVPREREDEIKSLVTRHHAQAEIGGTEAEIPPFP